MIVKLSKKAECELNKLAPIVMRQIVTHVDLIRNNPFNMKVKPLHGKWRGHFRYRVGKWRVIFALVGNEIVIKSIGHRQDIYK
ncbi:MAG: type II toxin-antitoxin system mRNA interferase toxin, RelE/StbE family [Nitrospirae bacterium]|uniref:Cytotoxic translational repressor of toxin-antitoxin stability system n=1 Tax=Candidatus Magnetobacterium casense TaxID=1455061 RepID=A0A088F8R7_9BACT|nr:cytotoxic translational repressor of toxin-antitoxin stability system [Candidatus Magnetobacterium casensis]MBF0337265.1 type II toxin-antitoxin system mRNA interferase toxin, RelE/StbE family [Nitrospirota bacterium]